MKPIEKPQSRWLVTVLEPSDIRVPPTPSEWVFDSWESAAAGVAEMWRPWRTFLILEVRPQVVIPAEFGTFQSWDEAVDNSIAQKLGEDGKGAMVVEKWKARGRAVFGL